MAATRIRVQFTMTREIDIDVHPLEDFEERIEQTWQRELKSFNGNLWDQRHKIVDGRYVSTRELQAEQE